MNNEHVSDCVSKWACKWMNEIIQHWLFCLGPFWLTIIYYGAVLNENWGRFDRNWGRFGLRPFWTGAVFDLGCFDWQHTIVLASLRLSLSFPSFFSKTSIIWTETSVFNHFYVWFIFNLQNRFQGNKEITFLVT